MGDAVNETKEKLKTLKTAAEQANTALANGDISQEQYDALQREILETEQALERLEEQAGESSVALQGIAATGTKFQEVGGKIENAGKALLPVSAAVTGIGVAGLKVATDFEKAMSSVKAITGATGEEFELLREKAIELGATTSFSFGEVAEAMTEMGKAGWTTQQILDGMASVLDATAASGESLGSVATIVADSITGFGLAASDSSRVADLLTQAANSGTIGITDLGESYKYIAPLAQSMGLSIEDVKYVVIPEEAEIVKDIFRMYLGGYGVPAIIQKLKEQGAETEMGNQWSRTSITKILRNYTYTGNLLLQRVYRENHLTKKTLRNEQEVVAELTRKLVTENASTARRQADYYEKYTSLVDRYEEILSINAHCRFYR